MKTPLIALTVVIFLGAAALARHAPVADDPIVGDYGRCVPVARSADPT